MKDWLKTRWAMARHWWRHSGELERAEASMTLERWRWRTRCEAAESAQALAAREFWAVQRDAMELEARLRALEARHTALLRGETAAGLSPAQVERLAVLGMAAGKLASEAAKAVLYGWASRSPATGRPAYVQVESSLGRVRAIVERMQEAGDVRAGDIRHHADKARARMEHAEAAAGEGTAMEQ